MTDFTTPLPADDIRDGFNVAAAYEQKAEDLRVACSEAKSHLSFALNQLDAAKASMERVLDEYPLHTIVEDLAQKIDATRSDVDGVFWEIQDFAEGLS